MDPTAVTCLFVIILEAIAGFFMNGFIVLVIFCNWLKEGITASVNKILVALSISNMCFAAMSLASLLIAFISLIVSLYSITSCSWLTACLCFFHFIKIVHFTGGFLARVKVQIDALVPRLILVAEVVSLCSGFIAALICVAQNQRIFTNTSVVFTANRRNVIDILLSLFQRVFVVILIFNLVPFFIMTITTFCTIGFLKMHIYRIQRSIGSSSNLKTHQSAASTMTKFLLFYLVFYLGALTYPFMYVELPYYSFYIYLVLSPAFTTLQSVLLIHANPRFKEALRFCLNLRNFDFQKNL
uniref:Taste receptor type 2 n=1 Tax=Leptobrachium leishanense TaxID=445787 RepID=A0A8C5QKV9_9ANUR